MTGHYAIFPTWECQQACPYCSIRNSKIDRTVQPVDWQLWDYHLPKALTRGAIVDVAGGEPLLYPGILELLTVLAHQGFRWALTTNGKAINVVDRMCRQPIPGGVCINVSDHPGNPEAHDSIARLRAAGYRVNVHRVDVAGAGHHEPDARLITYQGWREGTATDGKRRWCTAGNRHWVAGPNGDLWRCIVAMETGQPSTGNLFTGQVTPIGPECDFGCTSCYTEDPASWCVEMRAF